ncbi:helix-turn-helix domain-containing protein, partial [Planococcus sp. SIMBA_143]
RRLAYAHGLVLGDGRREITLKFTKHEMANMTGLARETVSRNISMFRKLGILEISKSGKMIVDLDELKLYG